MNQQLVTKENSSVINKLNNRIDNLENFLARPNIEAMQDIEYKKSFSDYIRKGNQNGWIEKSLHGGNEERGVIISSSFVIIL